MPRGKAGRACVLAWQVPWREDGRLVVGESPPHSSERQVTVNSLRELFDRLGRIHREVWEQWGVHVAVSLEGLSEPSLYVTRVGSGIPHRLGK